MAPEQQEQQEQQRAGGRRAWVVLKQLPSRTDSGGRQRSRAVLDAYAQVFDDVQVTGFDEWPDWREQLPAHVTVHHVGSPSPRPGAVLRASAFAGKWFSPALHGLLRRELRPGDVLHVDFPQMAVNVPAGVDVDVLDLHNVEADLLERRLRTERPVLGRLLAPEVERFRRYEVAAARRARHVTACSRRDQEVLRANGVETVFVPNGVTTAGRAPQPAPGLGRALFVGAADYGPNKQALRWFLDEVWPLVHEREPRARFTAVGRNLAQVHPRESGEPEGTEFRSDVPSVDPFYAEADVCVVPLLSGGGTKIKLVEALSRGRAVLTTSLGLEGLEVHRDVVEVADGAQEFADALVALLGDPARAAELGRRAAERVAESGAVSWQDAMTPLRDLLISMRQD
ncbi:glycosyltransferase family 4 protein [Kineococcus sp. SYSU DK004]|uniref:glycosyltransferase family 4 protein n=1 Tax=Kineococcus sp. SYSU DK004 TaxID=3383125 RepID=UPI003D7D7AB6